MARGGWRGGAEDAGGWMGVGEGAVEVEDPMGLLPMGW